MYVIHVYIYLCVAIHSSYRYVHGFPRWLIHLPTQEMKKTWIQSLGWEDPLEEEMATHSSILVWEIPWTKEPGGL